VKVWPHSLNGALEATAMEARSSRSVRTWNSSSAPLHDTEPLLTAASLFDGWGSHVEGAEVGSRWFAEQHAQPVGCANSDVSRELRFRGTHG
jgi:hypothetical protein